MSYESEYESQDVSRHTDESSMWSERASMDDIYTHAFKDCNMMTAYLNIQRKQIYKHMTHFTRVLDNCQGYGVSRYDVPRHVWDLLRERPCWSVDDIRALIKGSKGPLGYSICAYILKHASSPTGAKKFVKFSTHEYLLLKKLFKYILHVYREHPPASTYNEKAGKRKRGNFLNYTFVLQRLARHIGFDISHQLPSVKSRSTQAKYIPLAKWLDGALEGCPITMEDVCPSTLFTLKNSAIKL